MILGLQVAPAGAATGFSTQDVTLQMDDGVSLAATLYVPTGTPPQGGWPAVMLFHGLGGTRASMAPIATGFLANDGYAVLAYDARGHGASGGQVTLDGPREIQDARDAFAWLTSRPDVSDTQVGALGISLGGGAVLRAAVEGIPFKAIVPVITWTDLYGALAPQDLAKSGVVGNFLNSPVRWDPTILALGQDLLQSRNLTRIHSFGDDRSSLSRLGSLQTPAFFIQGRRDFAFDIAQATAGYDQVAGPKRLYIGDLGHGPAANPDAEKPHYLGEARDWFDRWLKGTPNGIDTQPPVELASDPWTGSTSSYPKLPPTKTLSYKLPGKASVAGSGKVVRTTRPLPARIETFGSAVVKLQASTSTSWPHLVVVVSALTRDGKEIVVSEGGTQPALTTSPGTITVRLLDDATVVPTGSRLRITVAPASTAQNPGNVLYLDLGTPTDAQLTVGKATLTLPVLKKPVSRRRAGGP